MMMALLLASCASTAANREALTDAVAEYTHGMRWSRLDFIQPHLPKTGVPSFEPMPRGIQVITCEVESATLEADARRATVSVRVEWMAANDVRLRSTLLRQIWRLADSRWEVIDQRAVEGPPFPSPHRRGA